MADCANISVLLTDIGGVLLSNGWDRAARLGAAERFGIDHDEMDERHHLTFDTYEEGKLSLDAYLRRVVFYKARAFSPADFREYMFAQSQPYPDTMAFVRKVAERNKLRVGAVSNEGRELTVYRIAKFRLTDFVQFFISSCFVHCRKPDEDIYRIALDVAQVTPEQAFYIDDRQMFVEVAATLGIRGVHHTSLQSTREAFAEVGLCAE
jgi:putative hydrolase of the HAD superfamily